MRILLADDSSSYLNTLKAIYEYAGHSVEIALNGAILMESLRARGPFDLIITDNEMPRKSGLEALREIRSDPELASIPVILCTGNDSAELRKAVKELEAQYILKSLTAGEELRAAIRKLAAK